MSEGHIDRLGLLYHLDPYGQWAPGAVPSKSDLLAAEEAAGAASLSEARKAIDDLHAAQKGMEDPALQKKVDDALAASRKPK